MYDGLDLAGREINKTGICLINDHIETHTVFEDDVVLELLEDMEVTAIDAPLTRENVPFREAERELMKEHGPILPLNMPGMKSLAERALRLKENITGCVIETYPRAVEKRLNIDMDRLEHDFKNQHEYDAYLCFLAAKGYDLGKYKAYGKGELIIIPEKFID